MKSCLVISAIFLCGLAFGQHNVCGWYGTLSAEKRRAMPPFASAEKVVLISFFTTASYSEEIVNDKGETVVAEDSLSIAQKLDVKVLREFDLSTVGNSGKRKKYAAIEMAELNSIEKDSLSRWFFNYRTNGSSKEMTMKSVKSYVPNNAVLFLDAADRVVAYIEVCFDCQRYVIKPDVAWFTQMGLLAGCDGKYEVLRQMFRKKKIGYGVDSIK
ncbi:hypothetical protein [Flavobacterium selenitireducens]|uniref:hypothetical protein n=1 Tax=Flavobacterium selenitireducens TaxID=2722704 RepID=UPI00168ADCB2|nr:hypothetical protein [Flavobacterium selenitireducens]MBD3581057.1 hypothetical protein [Flavobacterium selenitireducens]